MKQLHVRLDDALAEKFHRYKEENNHETDSAAVRQLINDVTTENQDQLDRIEEKLDQLRSSKDTATGTDHRNHNQDKAVAGDDDGTDYNLIQNGELAPDNPPELLHENVAKNADLKQTPEARVPVLERVVRWKNEQQIENESSSKMGVKRWDHKELRKYIMSLIDCSRPTADSYITQMVERGELLQHPVYNEDVVSTEELGKVRWGADSRTHKQKKREGWYDSHEPQDVIEHDELADDYPDYVHVEGGNSAYLPVLSACNAIIRDSDVSKAQRRAAVELASQVSQWGRQVIAEHAEGMNRSEEKLEKQIDNLTQNINKNIKSIKKTEDSNIEEIDEREGELEEVES